MKTTNSYQFFLKHAGYSHNPATESPMQGRVRCARQLAAAERKARDMGISYQWEQDSEMAEEQAPNSATLEGAIALGFDLSERNGRYIRVRCSQCDSAVINGTPAHEHGCPNRYRPQSYHLWQCTAWQCEGDDMGALTYRASLGGIDFGRDGEPWGNPYRRVVEAELALEALDNLKGE